MDDHCEPMETVATRVPAAQDRTVISSQLVKPFTDIDLENLYASLGINGDNNQIRYEAIHLRSSNELTVKDVIDYFSECHPKYVEMVDEESFNIVWIDRFSAARALFTVSQTVDSIPVRATTGHMIDNMQIPYGCWILGRGHINLSSVLLRFSMNSDKRPRTKEICSQYSRNNNPTISSEPVNKKNPWGNLSQLWDESSDRNRNQHDGGDARGRVYLKARRRTHK